MYGTNETTQLTSPQPVSGASSEQSVSIDNIIVLLILPHLYFKYRSSVIGDEPACVLEQFLGVLELMTVDGLGRLYLQIDENSQRKCTEVEGDGDPVHDVVVTPEVVPQTIVIHLFAFAEELPCSGGK